MRTSNGSTHCVLHPLKGTGAIFEGGLAPWITSIFALSLTTNVVATILIRAASCGQTARFVTTVLGTQHWGVVETIIQSAVIYSAALVSLLATYVAGSNAQYVCLDALQSLIGVVFTVIIIRVGLGETASKASSKGGNPYTTESRVSVAPGAANRHGQGVRISAAPARDQRVGLANARPREL